MNSSTRVPLLLCVLLAAAVAAIYGQTLAYPFVWIDDRPYVTDNPHVMRGLTWDAVCWAFTTGEQANWHPLTWLSHQLDVTLWGDWAGGHHLTNVVLHAVNSVLVFWVLLRLTGSRQASVISDQSSVIGHQSSGREGAQFGGQRDPSLITDNGLPITGSSPWPAAFVAALFAVHPMHVESVAWAAERKDVLCAFFFLLTLGAYGHYCGTRSAECGMAEAGGGAAIRHPQAAIRNACRAWYGLSLVFFVLSLLAKPMAVTLPFVLLLLDWWPLNRFQVSGIRVQGEAGGTRRIPTPDTRHLAPFRLLLEKLPFLLLSAASCVVTALVQRGAMSTVEGLPVAHRMANALISYVAYLGKLLWPSALGLFYNYRLWIPNWQWMGAALLLAALSALALMGARRRPYLLVGWLWYVGMLVPVIGLVQVGDQSMADRYSYLPYIGIFLALVWLAHDLASKRRALGWGAAAAGFAVLTALGVVAHRQVRVWRDSATLFRHTIVLGNRSEMNLLTLGAILAKDGRHEEAVEQLEAALQRGPHYADAYVLLATTRLLQGRLDEALAAARLAIRLSPNLASAHAGLADIQFRLDQPAEAFASYDRALAQAPDRADLRQRRAEHLAAAGRTEEALAECRAAVGLDPTGWATRLALVRQLARAARPDEAARELEAALPHQPRTRASDAELAALRRELAARGDGPGSSTHP